MSNETDHPPVRTHDRLAFAFGALLCRLWLAVRALQSGIEKFAKVTSTDQTVPMDGAPNEYGLTAATQVKEYAMSAYHGVPESLYTQFQGEPLMMGFALKIYDKVLGPALLVLGLAILLGIGYRCSLLLLGLLYISLTWGLILLGGQYESAGVAYLGIHLVLIVMALVLARHDRLKILNKW